MNQSCDICIKTLHQKFWRMVMFTMTISVDNRTWLFYILCVSMLCKYLNFTNKLRKETIVFRSSYIYFPYKFIRMLIHFYYNWKVLTKDSVTVSVDAVVYYRVSNATVSIANVENAHHSTRLLAQTTLRNTMGTRHLHEILSERMTISGTMQVNFVNFFNRINFLNQGIFHSTNWMKSQKHGVSRWSESKCE